MVWLSGNLRLACAFPFKRVITISHEIHKPSLWSAGLLRKHCTISSCKPLKEFQCCPALFFGMDDVGSPVRYLMMWSSNCGYIDTMILFQGIDTALHIALGIDTFQGRGYLKLSATQETMLHLYYCWNHMSGKEVFLNHYNLSVFSANMEIPYHNMLHPCCCW